MYTIETFISEVLSKLPTTPLSSDVSDISSESKNAVLEDIFKHTGQVDGWFVWNNHLHYFNAEANILRRIEYDDIGSYDVGTSPTQIAKPLILIKSFTKNSITLTVDGVELTSIDTIRYFISDSEMFIPDRTTVVNSTDLLFKVIDNLNKNTVYYIKVQVLNNEVVESESDVFSILTLDEPPGLTPEVSIHPYSTDIWDDSLVPNSDDIRKLKHLKLSNLVPYDEYRIRVVAVDLDGTKTAAPNTKNITITPPINTPTNVVFTDMTNDILVNMSSPTTNITISDPIRIEVVHSLSRDFTVNTVSNQYDNLPITLSSMESGKTYYIKIRFITAGNLRSPFTEIYAVVKE